MAYAKLVFPSGTYALQKLKEIARFSTGLISSTANLEFADQGLSEIVILDAPGWSLADSQVFETSGVATASSYKIFANCVDSAYKKYARLSAYDARTFSAFSGGSIRTVYNNLVASSATAGFLNIQLGTGFSSGSLQNATWYLNYLQKGVTSGTNYTHTANIPGPSLSESTIYVFASSRKIIAVIPETTGRCDLASILEFPMTTHAIKNSLLPALAVTSRYLSADSPSVAQDTPTSSSASNLVWNFYYSCQLSNWRDISSDSFGRKNLSDYGSNNIEFFSTPSLNINSSGATAYPLIPFSDIRTVYGEGIHNYSKLTDMYLTYRESSYNGQGDTITVDGTDYVIMQVGDAIANYRALAIKKG
jgi:hypothetical protein